MEEKKKILFLSSSISSFVKQDIDILKTQFDVRILIVNREIKNKKDLLSVASFLLKLIKNVIWSDVIFCWFASNPVYIATRLSQLLKKKIVVIIGGGEVANEPDIGYGALINSAMKTRIIYILNKATKIIAVSEFNKKEILRISEPRQIQLIYNSINTAYFTPLEEKEDIIITLCYLKRINVVIKGLEIFINAAKLLPQKNFYIIGESIDDSLDYLKGIAPHNVIFINNVSEDILLYWYRKAKVYCQLSYRESFGVAVAESMACGCIPVIADRGAMHEITGDIGYQVPYGDAKATTEAIKKALESNDGKRARNRIVEYFNSEKREKELINLLLKL